MTWLPEFEVVLTVLGLIIAAATAWSAISQASVSRTSASLAAAQRKDALFDRRHETVTMTAEAINLLFNEKGGTVQAIDALEARVQALFPPSCVTAMSELRQAAKSADGPLLAMALLKYGRDPDQDRIQQCRETLKKKNKDVLAAYSAFLKATKPHMSFDEPVEVASRRAVGFWGEALRIVLGALVAAVLALYGQMWLEDRQEGKAASTAACRLLPDMEVVQHGLALVAAEPLPQFHDLPKPSTLQEAARSAEGLPPEIYRMVVALRDSWAQVQSTLITATIEQDAEAKARLAEIADEAGQRTDALRSDLQRFCGE